ncbi:uncharacterized protein G2W53_026710 [Senna tora]|uniref:Uncharacterized protein n=1 Tax=Senna tora TaxID=362788 RepID=A0A834WFB9_9FABA|nr:uncharacterized protein G2W53_026710 [Senna tora]
MGWIKDYCEIFQKWMENKKGGAWKRYVRIVNDCDFFDWVEQDGKDIVIGRFRMEIAPLKGTIRRLQRVNKVLHVSTVILLVAINTIMLFICMRDMA